MSRSQAPPELPVDWEDKYLRVKQKLETFKAESNKKDQLIKEYRVKVRKLENEMNQMNLQMGGLPQRSIRDDNAEELEYLRFELKKEQSKHTGRFKVLNQQLEDAKKEIKILQRRLIQKPISPVTKAPITKRKTTIEAIAAPTNRPSSSATNIAESRNIQYNVDERQNVQYNVDESMLHTIKEYEELIKIKDKELFLLKSKSVDNSKNR